MRRTTTLLSLVVLLLLAASLGPGCKASPRDELTGTGWTLESWAAVAEDPAPYGMTLNFLRGKLGCQGAVNNVFGTYDTGVGKSLAINDLNQTRLPGDKRPLQADRIYVSFLDEARFYELKGDKLLLLDKDRQALMAFAPGKLNMIEPPK